ncbi:MAG: hypothetical protein NT112_02580 [Methanoregula sp.]|nr:hypothetical protein [Methanoregula sp.]
MGGRREDEPVPSGAIGQSGGCVTVRIFFRETGMPDHSGSLAGTIPAGRFRNRARYTIVRHGWKHIMDQYHRMC